jgi:predicted nucleic acid-binding protein
LHKEFYSKKIEFIDPEYVKLSIWKKAIKLTRKIDPADAPFVALALELDALFWTGDKKLMAGMITSKIDWVISTEVIKKIRDKE